MIVKFHKIVKNRDGINKGTTEILLKSEDIMSIERSDIGGVTLLKTCSGKVAVVETLEEARQIWEATSQEY